MATYIDTSVIIARYMPSDPSFSAVQRFFKKYSEPRYISEVSLLELYCVFSRIVRAGMLTVLSEVKDFKDLVIAEKVMVAVEHAIRTWRLTVAASGRSYVKFPLLRQTIDIEQELFEAILVSPRLGLKALDTLHLTYARAIRESTPQLETFTTLDNEIWSRREEIEAELGLRIVNPLKGA